MIPQIVNDSNAWGKKLWFYIRFQNVYHAGCFYKKKKKDMLFNNLIVEGYQITLLTLLWSSLTLSNIHGDLQVCKDGWRKSRDNLFKDKDDVL